MSMTERKKNILVSVRVHRVRVKVGSTHTKIYFFCPEDRDTIVSVESDRHDCDLYIIMK